MAKILSVDGILMSAIQFLKSIRLSAHDFVYSDGFYKNMVQVPNVAYHAGRSEYNGDYNLNTCSIGIELLVDGVNNYADWKKRIKEKDAFTNDHYIKCAKLCAHYCFEYDLHPDDAILLHSEVSGPDVRDDIKIDPGKGFDKQRLISMTKAELLTYPPLI